MRPSVGVGIMQEQLPVSTPTCEHLVHVLACNGAVPVKNDYGPTTALIRWQRRIPAIQIWLRLWLQQAGGSPSCLHLGEACEHLSFNLARSLLLRCLYGRLLAKGAPSAIDRKDDWTRIRRAYRYASPLAESVRCKAHGTERTGSKCI